jgi:hypothetical protein
MRLTQLIPGLSGKEILDLRAFEENNAMAALLHSIEQKSVLETPCPFCDELESIANIG